MTFWEKYINTYGKSVKNGYKSNAYSPIVWFMVFLLPLLMIVIILSKNPIIQYIFIGLFVVMVLFALLMYFLLFKKDPKLLQSENYRIEDRKLDLISEKGGELRIKPVDLTTTFIGGGGEHE